MKITIEPTCALTTFEGAPARVWRGSTERGVAVLLYVALVAAECEGDTSDLNAELSAIDVPPELEMPFWQTLLPPIARTSEGGAA